MECGIYDPLKRAEYICYWKQECDKLEAAIRGLDPANAAELTVELKRCKSIKRCRTEYFGGIFCISLYFFGERDL